MATQKPELLPILKALREYIVKEYGVNYPPHVRGEDASAKDMPADWVDKLNPITGGETEGRAEYGSAGGNSTKGASQGEVDRLHAMKKSTHQVGCATNQTPVPEVPLGLSIPSR